MNGKTVCTRYGAAAVAAHRAAVGDYATDHEGNAFVHVCYHGAERMRYGGKVEFRDSVALLVPMGREEEARALIGTIRRGEDATGNKYIEE